ncbi:DDE-type integrase/transposase/recombinase [Paraburkholderia sp. BR10936]|uniref:DDE-type integrase/transposase/recombinase n=1 Tax=Paraburkholderia sp. BR10936 TaxID=3236993 RepID=UPI0034D30549
MPTIRRRSRNGDRTAHACRAWGWRAITLRGYATSHRAVREMKEDGLLPEDTKVGSSKYLNNLIEQDHHNIKSRMSVMLGFERFRSATIVAVGIELMQRIREDQFNLEKLGHNNSAAPVICNAVLSIR